jgi:hypothetical protein
MLFWKPLAAIFGRAGKIAKVCVIKSGNVGSLAPGTAAEPVRRPV